MIYVALTNFSSGQVRPVERGRKREQGQKGSDGVRDTKQKAKGG